MDIHKPKAFHGWREFAKEYLIIVLGVVTALVGEAGVEWLHWRHQTDAARQALAYDLKRVMAWAGAQDSMSPCTAARLKEIEQVVDQAQKSGRVPPLPYIQRPSRYAWTMRSWSGLTFGQTLAHMTNREQSLLAALAKYMEIQTQWTIQQREDWALFQALSGAGRHIGEPEIAALRQAIWRERGVTWDMRRAATASETIIIESGLLSRPEAETAWKQGLDFTARSGACRFTIFNPDRKLPALDDALAGPVTQPGKAPLDELGVRGERLR